MPTLCTITNVTSATESSMGQGDGESICPPSRRSLPCSAAPRLRVGGRGEPPTNPGPSWDSAAYGAVVERGAQAHRPTALRAWAPPLQRARSARKTTRHRYAMARMFSVGAFSANPCGSADKRAARQRSPIGGAQALSVPGRP